MKQNNTFGKERELTSGKGYLNAISKTQMKPLSLFLPALFSYTNELGKIRNKKTDDRAAVEETGRKPGTNQTNKNENISI